MMHRSFSTIRSRFFNAPVWNRMSVSGIRSPSPFSQYFSYSPMTLSRLSRPFLAFGISALATTALGVSYGAACQPNVMEESMLEDQTSAHIYKIVLTGGPCAGKTTILSTISAELKKHGFDVYLVPEVATMLIVGGMDFSEFTNDKLRAFQKAIISVQVTMEDGFINIAESTKKPAVLIMDRGTLDTRAFLGSVMWDNLLEENEWDICQLRDERYDGIVHLVTAANGAPSFYTLENNEARHEDIQEAIDQDDELQEAWLGHSQHRVIDNSTGFKEKCDRAISAISCIIGLPGTAPTRKTYLVDPDYVWMDSAPDDVPFETFDLEYTFLKTSKPTIVRRIEKRTAVDIDDGFQSQSQKEPFSAHTYCVKNYADGSESQSRRIIQTGTFHRLLSQKDDAKPMLSKRRTIFLHNGKNYEFDEITGSDNVKILTVESVNDEEEIQLPEFMKILKEVPSTNFRSDKIVKT